MSVLAARAIDLLRRQTGLSDGTETGTDELLRRYQARIDGSHPQDSTESSMETHSGAPLAGTYSSRREGGGWGEPAPPPGGEAG